MLKVKTKSNPDLRMFVKKTKFEFEVALIFFNTMFYQAFMRNFCVAACILESFSLFIRECVSL